MFLGHSALWQVSPAPLESCFTGVTHRSRRSQAVTLPVVEHEGEGGSLCMGCWDGHVGCGSCPLHQNSCQEWGRPAHLGCGFPPHKVSLRNPAYLGSKVERKSEGECLERWEVKTATQLLCQLQNMSVLS